MSCVLLWDSWSDALIVVQPTPDELLALALTGGTANRWLKTVRTLGEMVVRQSNYHRGYAGLRCQTDSTVAKVC
jgi:hypothetical protein